jgi:5-methylcytosine-specific restriction endonuclease McrA
MTTLKPSLKAGTLFQQDAHSSFMTITGSRYRGMLARLERKGLPMPSFTLAEFRDDLLQNVMGGKEDGPIQCRYCLRWFTLAEVDVDHGTALSREGSTGLDNIDYPCAQDNDRKGSLSVKEYKGLLAYLESCHPLARQDILSRLEKANKLAASAARARGLMAELERIRKGGKPKPKAEQEFLDIPDEEDSELGPF